jgi:hypothetical protein
MSRALRADARLGGGSRMTGIGGSGPTSDPDAVRAASGSSRPASVTQTKLSIVRSWKNKGRSRELRERNDSNLCAKPNSRFGPKKRSARFRCK